MKNIVFLTLVDVDIEDGQSIYGSILRTLGKKGYNLFIVSPSERKNKKQTSIIRRKNVVYLKVKTGNIQKTNRIKKGISTLLIEKQYKKAIKKYFNDVRFDLVLYTTPPITFCNVVRFLKERDNAKTYLLLKDIFPQNAVDLHYFSKKSLLYYFFRRKEKQLYSLSDRIGCMSPANKEYLLMHNQFLNNNKIEIFPNSIVPNSDSKRDLRTNMRLRAFYNIPSDAKVFMYGGNIGRPQGVNFIVSCLKKMLNVEKVFFVICGNGTEYNKIERFALKNNSNNILLINGLPKEEYMELLNVADVGMIFLDNHFTIPNFPSRLLSYMEKGIPVLCCTDGCTDIGDIARKNGFGWSILSKDSSSFQEIINIICRCNDNALAKMGRNSRKYLEDNYNSLLNCKKIITFLEGFKK